MEKMDFPFGEPPSMMLEVLRASHALPGPCGRAAQGALPALSLCPPSEDSCADLIYWCFAL